MIKELFDRFVDFYRLLYSQPMFMTDAAVERLRNITSELGEKWHVLRHIEYTRGNLRWKITTKVHKLLHTPIYAERLNPRWVQNYAEESLVGSVTKTYKASVAGRYAREIQTLILLKRTLALCLRFES